MEYFGGGKHDQSTGAPTTYTVGQTVRIRKEKMLFARVFEQYRTLEVFRISKFLRRSLRPV